ncbi:MAG: hypothetical protein ACJASV_000927 [Pseudorhodobacter sp.]|jgi:hypothetical protein
MKGFGPEECLRFGKITLWGVGSIAGFSGICLRFSAANKDCVQKSGLAMFGAFAQSQRDCGV